MDSGWNSQLRDAIGIAHSGTVLWVIIIQVVISLLLGFWWIISICETRHFLTSFGKSIAFVLSNPLVNLSVLLVTGVGMIVISLFFAAIFGMSGSDAGIGSLIGMIIYLPFMFIFLLQVYDPRYRRVIAENRQTENEVHEIQNAQV